MKKKYMIYISVIIIILVLILLVFVFNDSSKLSDNKFSGVWNYMSDNEIDYGTFYTFRNDNTGTYTYKSNIYNFRYKIKDNILMLKYDTDNSWIKINYSISKDILSLKDDTGTIIVYKKRTE